MDYQNKQPIQFLALGDSYTIGESIPENETWPIQLAARLRTVGVPAQDPVIVARTGWTTAELQEGIKKANIQTTYDLVFLLIGVNNQYRGDSQSVYRQEFRDLLSLSVQFAGMNPKRVIVLSIPDWGVTPYAAERDREAIASEINAFNSINREEAEQTGAAYVDVTPYSRQASNDPSLIAEDGLHPSPRMYSAWVDLILADIIDILK
jgi:lysophospholipase L1-like esterase